MERGIPPKAPSELKQSGRRGDSLAWFFTHYMCTILRNNKFAYMVATMGLLSTTRGRVLAVSLEHIRARRLLEVRRLRVNDYHNAVQRELKWFKVQSSKLTKKSGAAKAAPTAPLPTVLHMMHTFDMLLWRHMWDKLVVEEKKLYVTWIKACDCMSVMMTKNHCSQTCQVLLHPYSKAMWKEKCGLGMRLGTF